jgi:hypothetical protein
MVMFVTAAIFWFGQTIAVVKREKMLEPCHCMIFITLTKLPALRQDLRPRPEESLLTPENFLG